LIQVIKDQEMLFKYAINQSLKLQATRNLCFKLWK
jgi:hypothetical protein